VNPETIRSVVRERYAGIAKGGGSCCAPSEPSEARPSEACCDARGPLTTGGGTETSTEMPADIVGSSLGCGAPIEAAGLRAGETVVDLGSGAGLDIFYAADRVGPSGRAIGIDMTPEMIARARANAARLGASNAEFRLGEIEHLPVADSSADVIISNCVINLLPDKRPAFTEAFRALKPGGRMVISDLVALRPLPKELQTLQDWAACVAGAIPKDEYLRAIEQAGFEAVEIVSERAYAASPIASVTVRAVKPRIQ
jgi:SAM-dependent methyltransferase